jgi:hypothetical protein
MFTECSLLVWQAYIAWQDMEQRRMEAWINGPLAAQTPSLKEHFQRGGARRARLAARLSNGKNP